MSKSSRDKGRRGELEAAEFLRSRGFSVTFDYGQSANGGCDLITSLGGCEVKRRARQFSVLYDALDTPSAEFVLHRDDRRPWLLTIEAAEGLEALDALRELRLRTETDSRTTITITKKNKVEGTE